ncbi:MAG: PQQ-binding-like beta-propeller repeat protein [Pirellulales bacterium]
MRCASARWACWTLFCLAIGSDLGLSARADDWPQWRGPQRDGRWREAGVVERFSAPRLEPKWRAKVGSGYSSPSVAEGRVFVTDRLIEPKQVERVHCFEEETGKPLWSHEYDCVYVGVGYGAGPRAAVSVDQGRAYVLGTMGHLKCFDAATGGVHWERDLNADYQIRMPIWGISASPLVYEDLVIVQIGGASGACLVALDKHSGSERWRALDDQASYSAPIIIRQAGQPVLVALTGENVVGLDPKTGEIHWRQPFPPNKMVIGAATPVVDGERLFVTSFYEGSLMLTVSRDKIEALEQWRRAGQDENNTDALHSIISTPVLRGGFVYGVDSYGELRCLDARNGDRIWENLTATPKARWSTIHFVQHGTEDWLFNERGELIIARLTPQGYQELSRTKIIEPTRGQLDQRGGVCWSHPAFANRCVFVRNDEELVCVDLAQKPKE